MSIPGPHRGSDISFEDRLNNIYEFSLYLKENTTLYHYKVHWLMLFKEITPVY
jgi:hypothetical protein